MEEALEIEVELEEDLTEIERKVIRSPLKAFLDEYREILKAI
jgi:flagellar motor switch protein FliM